MVTSLLTRPEDPEILKSFYRTVKPWGFWGPVYRMVVAEDPGFRRNTAFGRDMFNITLGIVAQTCLVAAPIFLVIRENASLLVTLGTFAVAAVVLKKTWYDRLGESTADA